MMRDLRLLMMFAVLRGGCGGRFPDAVGAEAPLRDVLAAALDENRQRSENARLRCAGLRGAGGRDPAAPRA